METKQKTGVTNIETMHKPTIAKANNRDQTIYCQPLDPTLRPKIDTSTVLSDSVS